MMHVIGRQHRSDRRRGLMARRLLLVAVLVVLSGLAAACNLGGDGGEAELALAIDESNPDKPVLAPAPDPVEVGQQYFIRLEVPRPLDTDFVHVRLEQRVGGSFRQRGEFNHPVTPPWNVAVIPITITDPGEWNIALIANSRKITDVTFDARRP